MSIRRWAAILVLILAVPQLGAEYAKAGDWPQILGPHRTGIAVDEPLADRWPEKGPTLSWKATVGSGFASCVIHQQTAVLFHRRGGNDQLTAYETKTGQVQWSQSFPTTFQPSIVEDDGPRATPTLHDGAAFALAANGQLHAVDLATGKPLWSRDTHREFQAPSGYFGAGSSPLVTKSAVIVNVGGDKAKAGVVALDRQSGKTLWTTGADQASYSSPVLVKVGHEELLLVVCRLHAVLVDPATGTERGRVPFGQRGPTVNAALPVFLGDKVFLTASYGIGAAMFDVQATGLKEIYRDDELLASQYTTPIVWNGHLFGVHGRQDGGPIALRCLDPVKKEVKWEQKLASYATLIASGDRLLVCDTTGGVKLMAMNVSKPTELTAAKLIDGTTRALPSLANGQLFVRNERELRVFSVR